MSKITVDLTELSSDQLKAFSLVDPQAVSEEESRREAYATLSDGLTDLAKATFKLGHLLDNMRNTSATVAVKETDIIKVVRRLLTRAGLDGVEFEQPTLEDIHA